MLESTKEKQWGFYVTMGPAPLTYFLLLTFFLYIHECPGQLMRILINFMGQSHDPTNFG